MPPATLVTQIFVQAASDPRTQRLGLQPPELVQVWAADGRTALHGRASHDFISKLSLSRLSMVCKPGEEDAAVVRLHWYAIRKQSAGV